MSKQQRDSQKRFAFAVKLFAEGSNSGEEVPSEIQVIPCGEWHHPAYGPMKIAPADIAEMKKNFDDGVRLDLPITAGHDNGFSGGELPASGWYKELIDKGYDGLWAKVEFNERGAEHLTKREFKYFSSEFYSTYSDPQTGEIRKNVLVGGALTNRPYFKEMEPVGQFSEAGIMSQTFSEDMNIKDILAKKVADLSAEEKAFLKQHSEELTAEQKKTFEEVIGDTEGGNGEGEGDNKPTSTEQNNASEMVTISAAELATLKTASEQGAKALQKIEASEREAFVNKLTFSSTNSAGRFLEKDKATLETFVKTLSEAQRKQFGEVVTLIPASIASKFKETGDSGSEGGTSNAIAKQAAAEANAKIAASSGKISFAEAMAQVFAEKPELKQQYDEAFKAGRIQ